MLPKVTFLAYRKPMHGAGNVHLMKSFLRARGWKSLHEQWKAMVRWKALLAGPLPFKW